MPLNGHCCTLTPTLVAPDLASKTNATFSKATVDILEVIGDIVMPPFSLLQLALLSQVKKVSRIVASLEYCSQCSYQI